MIENIDFRIIYPFGSLVLLLLWLIIFKTRRDLRKLMLLFSIIFAFVGVLGEYFYFKDYWYPPAFIELNILGIRILPDDILFGFVSGGTLTFTYIFFFKYKIKVDYENFNKRVVSLLLYIALGFALFAFIITKFNINSIFATGIGCFLMSLIIITKRSDLAKHFIVSALVYGVIAFIFYFFFQLIVGSEYLYSVWLLDHSKFSFSLFGVAIPLTEVFFSASVGSALTILSAYIFKYKFIK